MTDEERAQAQGQLSDFIRDKFQDTPPCPPWGASAASLIGKSNVGLVLGAAGAKHQNPKQAYGDKKPPVHLIHMIAQLHEAAALHAGKLKYGENNYLQTPVEIMTYIGAIMRHCLQYASGERVDCKELVHHLGAIKACCTILLSAEATGMLIDNRVCIPASGEVPSQFARKGYEQATRQTFEEVERICAHLNNLYPNLL